MASLRDYLSIENLPPSELTEVQKQKFDFFLQKVQDLGLDKIILTYSSSCAFVIINEGQEISSYLPEDLTQKLMALWVAPDIQCLGKKS